MTRHGKQFLQFIPPNLRDDRGFAVLLYSYIVTWFVVMFTTTLLTMSTLDVNHAQRAIATQQAFWAAEGELEGAVAELKVDQTVFALAKDMCVSYGSRNLKSDGSIRSTSSLCGTSTTNTYRLAITGTSGSTTQTLATIVDMAGAGMTQFSHVAYADGITAKGVTTGSIDTVEKLSTQSGRTLLASLSNNSNWIHDNQGSLATRRSARALREVWHNGAYVHQDKPPIEIIGDSRIYGPVFLGPHWSGQSETVEIATEADVVAEAGEDNVQALPEEATWPSIEIPEGATNLGILKLDEPNGGHPNRQLKMVLAEGAYQVERLILTNDAELCTIGTVELYVTGSQSDEEADDEDEDGEPREMKINVHQRAKLYGQPSGASAYARYYSPANLRIFVKGPGIVKIGARDAVTVALIYAPEAQVKAKAGTFLGAIMAKSVELEKHGNQKAKLIYDRSLTSQSIPVGVSNDVAIKVWTDGELQ
ncbi:MAG: hypothetical protein HY595_00830 [Candidatus Omnitrophica bacterium]|nr:hypothetical protein [Candidatus Omnitrophota bacterium]